jgi:hypothetical protein
VPFDRHDRDNCRDHAGRALTSRGSSVTESHCRQHGGDLVAIWLDYQDFFGPLSLVFWAIAGYAAFSFVRKAVAALEAQLHGAGSL